MNKKTARVTYQPYLFAISILGLLVKLVYSAVNKTPVFDITIIVILVVFLVSSFLYFYQYRNAKKQTKLDVSLKTSDVKDSTVIGAESRHRDRTNIKIETGKVAGSKVKGYEEKE